MSERGPCLVGGTMTLDDVSFTTRFAIHSGGDVTQAPLDTGSPQTFIRRNVLDRMLLVAVCTSYGLEGGTLPPRPGVGLGGLVPRTDSAVLGGLLFTSADYCDFRTHGPHMRIDDLSAPSGRFVARVSASVTTVNRCPSRGRTCLLYTSPSPRDKRQSRMPSSA